MIETVRLSQDQRNKLLRIRKKTGVKNWNVLCRWALCYSLAAEEEPPQYVRGGKVGIEIDWPTFTGREQKPLYDAIFQYLGTAKFYSHVSRGIDILTNKKDLTELLSN